MPFMQTFIRSVRTPDRIGRPILRRLSILGLPLVALILVAAAPTGFNLTVPQPGSNLPVPPEPPAAGPPSRLQPAPTPNRDVELTKPKASTATTVSPSLFTRPDEYRGDGFSKGSTAQSEQEKRVKPGAGFSLHMPLSPN
jgi:hypothetical protein